MSNFYYCIWTGAIGSLIATFAKYLSMDLLVFFSELLNSTNTLDNNWIAWVGDYTMRVATHGCELDLHHLRGNFPYIDAFIQQARHLSMIFPVLNNRLLDCNITDGNSFLARLSIFISIYQLIRFCIIPRTTLILELLEQWGDCRALDPITGEIEVTLVNFFNIQFFLDSLLAFFFNLLMPGII